MVTLKIMAVQASKQERIPAVSSFHLHHMMIIVNKWYHLWWISFCPKTTKKGHIYPKLLTHPELVMTPELEMRLELVFGTITNPLWWMPDLILPKNY